jgi:hypothetical protein
MLSTQYEGLGTREGFNLSLRHFKQVNGIVGDLESYTNLADQVNELLGTKAIESSQIQPIINALLIDRYHYRSRSHNLTETVEDLDAIRDEVSRWTAVDVVIAYYSPELGLAVVNPKNDDHLKAVQSFKKTELVTVYCGAFSQTDDRPVFDKAVDAIIGLLEGRKAKTPAGFTGGRFKQAVKKAPKAAPVPAAKAAPRGERKGKGGGKGRPALEPVVVAAAQAAAPGPAAAALAPAAPPEAAPRAAGAMRVTPLYGVVVTNELFHNGNVEAWKKIIQSYEHSHAGLRVNVYYEGEKIHDINTLFKWGKVKRGTPIMFSVQGENIGDVAKLQRYFKQGASHLFEAFLKGSPGQILNLF